MENHFDLDPHELFKELGEAVVYRNDESPEAGRVHYPSERRDEFKDNGNTGEDGGEEDGLEQSSLTDF